MNTNRIRVARPASARTPVRRLLAVLAVTFAALLPTVATSSPAGAVLIEPEETGNTSSSCSPLNSICVGVASTDGSGCRYINMPWPTLDKWVCNPAVVATATPAQPGTSDLTNSGSVAWNGTATCTYRMKAQGSGGGWTPSRPCPKGGSPAGTLTGSDSRDWTVQQSPQGGSIRFEWDMLTNTDTLGHQDCVEITVSLTTSATANSYLGGIVPFETTTATTTYPNGTNGPGAGTHRICE